VPGRPDGRALRTPTAGASVGPAPKTVEPIALEAGRPSAPSRSSWSPPGWNHDQARDTLPEPGRGTRGVAGRRAGRSGWWTRRSCRKWGGHTPGCAAAVPRVRRKIDNGIVTVHIGWRRAPSKPWLDAACTCRSRGPRTAPGAGPPVSRTMSGTGEVAAGGWTSGSALAERGVVRLLVSTRGTVEGSVLRFLNLVGQRFVARSGQLHRP